MSLGTIWKHRDNDIMLKVLVMVLYIADVFSDLFLAAEYLLNDQYFYATLTLTFVWIPSTFVTYDSYRRKSKLKLDSCRNVCLCVVMVLFGMEPVLCYFQSIKYAVKVKSAEKEGSKRQRERYYEKMLDQNRDVVDLKLYEGCMEAVPQLILQLSIILKKYGDMTYDLTRESWFSVEISNFLGVILTCLRFQCSSR